MESKKRFNPNTKSVIDNILLNISGVTEGNMFGYPAYYINGKLLACHYHEGIAVKVPQELGSSLLGSTDNEVEAFRPMGKKMGENWILLNRMDSRNYHNNKKLFEAAAAYVKSLAK